jgi:hypothetical protein
MVAGGGLSGSVPTPHGPVSIAITVAPLGGGNLSVHLPAGCVGGAVLELSEVLLARMGWHLDVRGSSTGGVLLLNGAADPASFAANRGPLFESELAGPGGRSGVWSLRLPPGEGVDHVVTFLTPPGAILDGSRPSLAAPGSPFPPPAWPSRVVAVDTETAGDWIGRFGAAGYVLFGFNANTTDLVSLPPFLESVTSIDGTRNNWALPLPINDTRALQNPVANDDPSRSIGCTFNSMTVAIDIFMQPAAEGTWYQVAAYVVDYDRGYSTHSGFGPRHSTIALLQRDTLNSAAPVQVREIEGIQANTSSQPASPYKHIHMYTST